MSISSVEKKKNQRMERQWKTLVVQCRKQSKSGKRLQTLGLSYRNWLCWRSFHPSGTSCSKAKTRVSLHLRVLQRTPRAKRPLGCGGPRRHKADRRKRALSFLSPLSRALPSSPLMCLRAPSSNQRAFVMEEDDIEVRGRPGRP